MSRVAFVGLGAMGSRMARRLLEAGHDLLVWNRSAEKAAALVELGATLVESPAEAARGGEAVMTMVADPKALQAVVDGPDGIAADLDGTTTVIEMSTVGPAAIEWLAGALPEGTPLLDAPVLGSLSEAEAGSLRVFVGGPEDLARRWEPLFKDLGSPIHVGDLGMGAAAKLVANTTLVGALGVLGEAVALAEGLGLAQDKTFEVLAPTPMGAQAERRRDAIESGDYPRRFALELALKDADLIAGAATDAGVELRLTEAARSWFRDAVVAGLGERDYSEVLEHIRGSRRRA